MSGGTSSSHRQGRGSRMGIGDKKLEVASNIFIKHT